ncbi:MAG: sigma 54-interacting transcriptional regulator [Polyangia bacterium]
MRPQTKKSEIGLVCESRAMRRFVTELENVAPSDMPVLIWGEPGVGKERAARALHRCSGRGAEPFEVIRCSGLDGAALQAVLADALPRARSGSVLLDGVEELDAAAQNELLRVLQSPLAIETSGLSSRRLRHAPRWISNAAEDLDPLVRRGRLRRDLYHRLAAVRLHLPPLRTRGTDLPALATDLIAEQVNEGAAASVTIDEEALTLLRGYPWPGNVREFATVLTQAAWRAREGVLRAADLGDLLAPTALNAAVQIPLGTSLAIAEQILLRATLAGFGGNKKRTADALGITRRTLYLKLGRT